MRAEVLVGPERRRRWSVEENLLWVQRFTSIEELRQALREFRRCYNQTWIVERHGYRTPAQVRAE